MSILVYGAGGLGLYFAARLAQGGQEVILKARTDAVQRSHDEPVTITRDGSTQEVHGIHLVDTLEGTRADAAIVTTKAWQVEEASRDMSAVLPVDAPVLTTQNGIDAAAMAATSLQSEQVFASTVVVIAERMGPLDVRMTGPEASLTVGSPAGQPASRTRELIGALDSAGISATWTEDIAAALWKKLALICSYGGIGAMLDATVGQTREDARSRGLVATAMTEVFSVADTEGVTLTESDFADDMDIYLKGFSSETTSSMHRDLLAGRPSELEDQVGAVVHRAQRARVPTPVLDLIYASMAPREARARR